MCSKYTPQYDIAVINADVHAHPFARLENEWQRCFWWVKVAYFSKIFKKKKKTFSRSSCFLTRQIYDTKKTDKHISWNTSVRGLSNLLDLCSFLKFIPRVKGVLQNSDSFLPSFNCDNSSPYNVKNKCKLWWTVMIWPFILQHTVPMYLKSNNRCIWDRISVVASF